MSLKSSLRYASTAAVLFAAATVLSGCLGDPTYGTGTTQSAHLVDDLGNLISLPKNNASNITYAPRAGLVEPPKGEAGELPPPQQKVASTSNPNWPTSPEEYRKQVDEKIYKQEHPMNVPARTAIHAREGANDPGNSDAQVAAFRQAITLQEHKYTGRKFLSDPPADVAQPAPTAPTGELGEREEAKNRKNKAASERRGPARSLVDY